MTSKTARKPTRLYRYIEHLQGHHSWGTILDAGTGVNSALDDGAGN